MKYYKCAKCGYKWLPRTEEPTQCPKCKTRYWKEEDRKNIKTKKG